MILTSPFKILLLGVVALACLLEIGEASMTTPRRVQKGQAMQKHMGESMSLAAVSSSASSYSCNSISDSAPASASSVTLSSNSVTTEIEIETKTKIEISSCSTTQPVTQSTTILTFTTSSASTSFERRVPSSLTEQLSEKSLKLLSLQKEFTVRHQEHHSLLHQKLKFVNTTLTDIAVAMLGSSQTGQGQTQTQAMDTDKDIKFLQHLFFNIGNSNAKNNAKGKENTQKERLQQILNHLKTRAGDNQQIDFPAVVKKTKDVIKTTRVIEHKIAAWDVYVEGFNREVQEILNGVEGMDSELQATEVIEVSEIDEATETVEEMEDTGDSIAGVLVRVKSWLNQEKAALKAEAGEGQAENSGLKSQAKS